MPAYYPPDRTTADLDLPDRFWKSRAEKAEADLRRLHIWAGVAANYVERYTRLMPDERSAKRDLENLRRLLSDIDKPEPSSSAEP